MVSGLNMAAAASTRDPRLDWLLRLPPKLEELHEIRHGESRVAHLRLAVLVGLIVNSFYNLSGFYLLNDVLELVIVGRLLLITGDGLLLVWLISRVPAWLREVVLVPAILLVVLVPLLLVWLSDSPFATYTLAELPLMLVFGNMLAVLRFRHALVFTVLSALAAAGCILLKPGIDPALHLPLIVLVLTGVVFTLYGNWYVERNRCRLFLAEYDARSRADLAEETGSQLRDLTLTDTLTGIANRRHLDQRLESLLAGPDELVVMMADVDHFKPYNDQLGHPAGDACLREVAAVLSAFAAAHDGFAARFGGEEFTLVFRAETLAADPGLGDRLVAAVRDRQLPHPGRPDGLAVVTVSVGQAATRPGEPRLAAPLIARADEALYRAKSEGRNRCRRAG